MTHIELNGKITGIIKKEEQKYITYRNKEKHTFKKYSGYGISKEIIRILKDENIQKIIIIEKNEKQGTQKLLKTTLPKLEEKGITYKNNKDEQLILPLSYWETE